MNPGIYPDLPNEEYHASPGISKSGLDLIAKCPALYKARYIDGLVQPETKALKDGHALHLATLEPDKFREGYAVAPKCDRRTKAGKALWEEFCSSVLEGTQVITQEEYDLYFAVSSAVRSNPRAAAILDKGQAETSIFHKHEETGELVKIRPDWFIEDIMVDIKFMRSAEAAAFTRDCYTYRYYVQSAFYMDIGSAALGREFTSFIFIVVEKEPPFLVSLYAPDEQLIREGRTVYLENLYTYCECKASGHWPDYNDGRIVPVSLPTWIKRQVDESIYETF